MTSSFPRVHSGPPVSGLRSRRPGFEAAATPGGRLDLDRFHSVLLFRSDEIDMKKSVVELRTHHFNAFSQHKAPLKLAGGNAAVQIDSVACVLLPATDGQLPVLNLNLEVS